MSAMFAKLLDSLILSLYAVSVDFVFGVLLVRSVSTVNAVKKGVTRIRRSSKTRYHEVKVKIFALVWVALLIVLLVLVFVTKFLAAVYNTVHIALIINNFIQLINTLQFFAAFQLLREVEFVLSVGTGRRNINSEPSLQSSKDYASDMQVDSSMAELYD